MGLYPWCMLEFTTYHFDFTDCIQPCSSLLEAHRRVLELELVCKDLTVYLPG
jgi:hypothetical protein